LFVVSYVESSDDDSPLRALPSTLPDLENVERAAQHRVMNGEIPGAGGYVVYDEAADGLEVARWYQS
jgi:hypothetical protein